MSNEDVLSAIRKANKAFAAPVQRDAGIRHELAAAKASSLARMAELKALRLARDAEQQAFSEQRRKPRGKRSA